MIKSVAVCDCCGAEGLEIKDTVEVQRINTRFGAGVVDTGGRHFCDVECFATWLEAQLNIKPRETTPKVNVVPVQIDGAGHCGGQ